MSLAGQARLRKLRVTESEDVINGKEYTRRLRKQFLRLHPTPDWANPDLARRKKTDSVDSDADSGEEMDTDAEADQLSSQPLARLLQNATDLTRSEDNARTGGKRKLRQEVIEIQRLKDVGKAQPVRCPRLNQVGKGHSADTYFHKTVLYRLTYVPPSLPAFAVLWACLDSLPASCLSLSTCP